MVFTYLAILSTELGHHFGQLLSSRCVKTQSTLRTVKTDSCGTRSCTRSDFFQRERFDHLEMVLVPFDQVHPPVGHRD